MRVSLALFAAILAALSVSCGARSGLIVSTEEFVVCPLGAYAVRLNEPVDLSVRVSPGARGRLRWEIDAQPPGASAQLTPDGASGARFQSAVEGGYSVRVSLPEAAPRDAGDAGDDPRSCLVHVNVRARGPQVVCPPDVNTAPLTTVPLTARVEGDRMITSREWTLTNAPAGSARPELMPRDQLTTNVRVDVAGDYVLRFVARDAAGEEGSCFVTVHAVSTEALRVEMFWNPPADPSDHSDVDLHLLRGGGGRWIGPDDCYYSNCPDGLAWDAPGAGDDPRLDIDDVEGFGPENINIQTTGNRWYRIGVHMFAGDGRASSDAHVVVYCRGARVMEFGPVTVHERGNSRVNDFWLVADVVMSPTGCEVRPILRDGMPWIFSQDEASANIGPPAP